MRKIIYNIATTTVIILCLSLIHSCTEDRSIDYDDASTDNITFQLSLNNKSLTKVQEEPGNNDGDFNEQKIKTLDVFFYQGNTLKWKVAAANLTFDEHLNKVIIPIKEEKKGLFKNNTTITYDIIVVANNTAELSAIAEEGDNLQALKDLLFDTPNFIEKGGSEPQEKFVMDGKISKIVNLNDPALGVIHLKRIASKIRLRVLDIDIPGYVLDGQPKARLVHFTNKSTLLADGATFTLTNDDWRSTKYKPLSTDSPVNVGGGRTTAAPFYAYSNNWQTEKEQETYIQMHVPLKGSNNVTNTYSYRLPITPKDLVGEQAKYMNRLDRNFLYDVSVSIHVLGSVEEPPVEVIGSYLIKDWTTQEVLIHVKAAHYLVVSERDVVMPNVESYTLTFNSSVADVVLVPNSLKATYTYVPAGGSEPTTVNVEPSQMPTVRVEPNTASGAITIQSPIPVNYIPKDIEFKITNGELTETVTISQLPVTYFTVTKGVRSYMPGEGTRNRLPSGNTNPYMYMVTSMAPDGDIIWGFPPTDTNGNTVNNEEVSKMVSPKFEMASQFGASLPKTYSSAQTQCRGYTETAEDGTVKGGWRLPTAAEIHYIDVLQQTAPTRYVMEGNYYWSNWSRFPTIRNNRTVYGAYKMGENLPYKNPSQNYGSSATYSSAHTRCIRDIKD